MQINAIATNFTEIKWLFRCITVESEKESKGQILTKHFFINKYNKFARIINLTKLKRITYKCDSTTPNEDLEKNTKTYLKSGYLEGNILQKSYNVVNITITLRNNFKLPMLIMSIRKWKYLGIITYLLML